MSTAPTALDSLLASIPEDRVLTGEEAREWLVGFPAAVVVFPESLEEIRDLVLGANDRGVRIMPAGFGGWLAAGGWGRPADVAVSTSRLNRIRVYEPADLTMTADSGLSWPELESTVSANRQWLPVDPPGRNRGTLGGAVATGASGPLRSHYGAIRDNVLGVEAVTGDGRVLHMGGRVVKNVAGYDLVRLMTGSRGSLGVITAVSVRLFPTPQADRTLVFSGEEREVVEMARSACTCPVSVAAVEIDEVPSGPEGELTLATRLVGVSDEVEDAGKRVLEALGRGPSLVLEGVGSANHHVESLTWEEDATFVARLSALPSRLGDLVSAGRRVAGELGGTITAHAAQGVLRVKANVADEAGEALVALVRDVRRDLEESGGGLLLSRAPSRLGEAVGWSGASGAEGRLSDGLKGVFDPVGTLAPRRP